jgi:hypothetical protein
VRASGGWRRKAPSDAPAGQFREPRPAVLPLLPGDGGQQPPGRPVKFAQHRGSLAEAEIGAPSGEVARQYLDGPREAFAAGPGASLPELSP